MKIAAIVDVRGSLRCYIVEMPYFVDEYKIFETVDAKIKRDIDPDGLVVDIYDVVRYVKISTIESKRLQVKKAEIIVDQVCIGLELNYDKLISPDRHRKYTDGRKIISHYINQYCELTLNEIGSFIGDRDHSTVINCMNRYRELVEVDPDFMHKVAIVAGRLSRHPMLKRYVEK